MQLSECIYVCIHMFNVREGASPLRASLVIFLGLASLAWKILVRTIHNDKKYDCKYDKNMIKI